MLDIILEGLRHPLTVAMGAATAGFVLTGLLVPSKARQWQTRQKELDIKIHLVSEMSETVMSALMARQYLERARAVFSADDDLLTKYEEEYHGALRQWEVRKAVVGTKLEAYLPRTDMGADWYRLSEKVREACASGLRSLDPNKDIYPEKRRLIEGVLSTRLAIPG